MAYRDDENDDWEADLAEADQPWNDDDAADADPEDEEEDERSWHDDADGYGEGGTVIRDEGTDDDG